jgi:hypothetical protein
MALLAFATFAMLSDETSGETADVALIGNFIPEISCSTTAVIKNDDPTGFRYSEYQTKICGNFESQFFKANRELADLPKKSSTDMEKLFEKWVRITASFCKEIMVEEKLATIDHACLFGVPAKEQPIARAMYELYLEGKLPDSYSDGSWCTTAARQENNSQKIALLEKVFGNTDGPNAWSESKNKLLREGFHLVPGTGEYYRSLGTGANSDGTAEGWIALPFPIFSVYFGQERTPQRGELCTAANANCASQSNKAKVQDGVCMTWEGYGP